MRILFQVLLMLLSFYVRGQYQYEYAPFIVPAGVKKVKIEAYHFDTIHPVKFELMYNEKGLLVSKTCHFMNQWKSKESRHYTYDGKGNLIKELYYYMPNAETNDTLKRSVIRYTYNAKDQLVQKTDSLFDMSWSNFEETGFYEFEDYSYSYNPVGIKLSETQ